MESKPYLTCSLKPTRVSRSEDLRLEKGLLISDLKQAIEDLLEAVSISMLDSGVVERLKYIFVREPETVNSPWRDSSEFYDFVLDYCLVIFIKFQAIALEKIARNNQDAWLDLCARINPSVNQTLDVLSRVWDDDRVLETTSEEEMVTATIDWTFKYRVLRILFNNAAILKKTGMKEFMRHSTILRCLSFIKLPGIQLDREECSRIIKHIIYPALCSYADIDSIDKELLRPYSDPIRTLCNMDESILSISVEYASEWIKTREIQRRMSPMVLNWGMPLAMIGDGPTVLLLILLRIAKDQRNWKLINESICKNLFPYFFHPRIQGISLWLLLTVIEESPLALDELSGSLLWVQTILDRDPLVLDSWRRLAKLTAISRESRELFEETKQVQLRSIIGALDKRLMVGSMFFMFAYSLRRDPADVIQTLQNLQQRVYDNHPLFWLMMPRQRTDFPASSLVIEAQLIKDWRLLIQNYEVLPIVLKLYFDVFHRYLTGIKNRSTENLFRESLTKVFQLLLKELDEENAFLMINSYIHMDSQALVILNSFGLDRNLYCRLLLGLHGRIQAPQTIDVHLHVAKYHFLLFATSQSWNSKPFMAERFKLFETVLIRAYIETLGKGRREPFVAYFLEKMLSEKRHSIDQTVFKLLNFVKSNADWDEICSHHMTRFKVDAGSLFNGIVGIQSRRLLLMSLCRLLTRKLLPLATLLPVMIEEMDKLQFAYELRQKQSYTEKNYHLLPTCLEIAFRTPFDNSKSRIYVCEFKYLKTTLQRCGREVSNLPDISRNEIFKKRVEYFQHNYDKFAMCCSQIDPAKDLFACVGHSGYEKETYTICPLLNREFLYKHKTS